MDPQKIKLRRGNKANVPLLDQGEPAITLDTKEIFVGTPSGNFNVMNRNHVFSPLNFADKASGLSHFIQVAGAGMLSYDALASSAVGTGAYTITGNGTWILDEMYACGPLVGIGGHIAVMNSSGSATVSAGVRFYASDKTTTLGTTNQQFFIRPGGVTTGSYVLSKASINNEGVNPTELPVGARWLTPQITVSGNTGTLLVDYFMVFPLTFAALTLYK